MDDQRVGAAFRVVRIRRGWTQAYVAVRADSVPGVVSRIERGHLENVSMRAFRRVAAALEIRVDVTLRLPHGELDRIVNAGHAAMHEALARFIDSLPGWIQSPEVSFAIFGERGVIDILAFHEPSRSVLLIELKTEVVALEELLAAMDIRVRHARQIARDRGWHATSVSAWIVVAESDTNRRRVRAHLATLRSAYPSDGRGCVRGWHIRAGRSGPYLSGQTSLARPLRGPPPHGAGFARSNRAGHLGLRLLPGS